MVSLRPMARSDWRSVAEIYRQGIEAGGATFETEVPDLETWDVARHSACRLVADSDGEVAGFAALSPVSKRPVYAGVCEVMVYVAERRRGQGIGAALLDELARCSEQRGIWTLQAGIFPENEASVLLHRRAGFRVVGTRERIGCFHDGRWRDTVLMERRSAEVGRP